MKKAFIFVLAVLLAAAAFAAGEKEAQGAAAAAGGEFIIGNGAEPASLDPHLQEGVPEHRISVSLFEGLVSYDPKTALAVPGVAESWSFNADKTVVTFKLRKAVWSDGEPITAKTVYDSWLRILSPELASPYAWFPSMFIAGAEQFNQGKSAKEDVKIRVIDDYTFEVTLVGPLPYAVDAMAHNSFAIVPMHAIAKFGTDWTKPGNFVGNGPFVLEGWKPQESVTAVPNLKYWDAKTVKLSKVTYLPIVDNNTSFNMFLNGEIDYVDTVPLDQLDVAKARADYHNSPYLGTYYYLFNNAQAPVNDPRVRKALSMAVDKSVLVGKITRAGQVPAYSMVPKMAGYEPHAGNTYNVQEAKKLLADAGFPGGKGFPKLQILYNTSEAHKKIAEYVQQQWAENLGIQVELFNQEWATYLDTRDNGDYVIARAAWVGDYQDPNTFLDMFVTGHGGNDAQYSNAKYDGLVRRAATMAPGAERLEVLRQADEILSVQDQGVMPIYFYTTNNMIDLSKWDGWYPTTLNIHPTKYIFPKK